MPRDFCLDLATFGLVAKIMSVDGNFILCIAVSIDGR